MSEYECCCSGVNWEPIELKQAKELLAEWLLDFEGRIIEKDDVAKKTRELLGVQDEY